jgi:hypothetical protein
MFFVLNTRFFFFMTFMKDLWTTRCTRCPAALDILNQFAIDPTRTDEGNVDTEDASSVQCISICCGDTLDGAREIIEVTKLPRWGAIQHYFMAHHDKERCKELLKFRQVPFYIVFSSNGTLLYHGNQKLNWQTLFNENSIGNVPVVETPSFNDKATNPRETSVPSPTSALSVPVLQQQQQLVENSALVIEDMDF